MRWIRAMRDVWRGMGRGPAPHPGDPSISVQDLDELLVYDVALSWEYEPTPPYAVRVFPAVGRGDGWGGIPTLEVAIEWFAREALPLRAQWMASVTDFLGIVVVGFNTVPTDSPCGHWIGCQAGFRHLEIAEGVNPVDCAIWEMRAKGALG